MSAVHETIAAINKNTLHNKANAWACIQLYYATFFAAHAILRFFGLACCQLYSEQTAAIVRSAVASGFARQTPSGGLYLLSYEKTLGTLTGTLLVDSHADTWGSFCNLLTGLSSHIPSVAALGNHKISAIASLDELLDILKRDSNSRGAWLSAFRNRVNYQKSDGLWYPYGKGIPTHDELMTSVDRWRNRKATFHYNLFEKSDLGSFIEASTGIIWLSRELLLGMSSARIYERHFLDTGGLDFLRYAKWHNN